MTGPPQKGIENCVRTSSMELKNIRTLKVVRRWAVDSADRFEICMILNDFEL